VVKNDDEKGEDVFVLLFTFVVLLLQAFPSDLSSLEKQRTTTK